MFLLLTPSLTLREKMSLPLFIKTSKYEKNKAKEIHKSNEYYLKEDRGLIMSQPTMIIKM